MTVRLVVNFILAGLAVAALVFDKNKYDKILGALLLVFAAQGIISHYLGGIHPASIVLAYCLPPAGLAFILVAANCSEEKGRKILFLAKAVKKI